LDNGKPAFKHGACIYKINVADRLCAYEDTGLTPKEITSLIADNKRLHALVDTIEEVLKGK